MATNHPEERTPRVLLIDDSDIERRWLRAQLGTEHVEVVEAPDGLKGLEICHTNPPDLILLDLNLPFCDGFEILRRLKGDRRTNPIPVIVVSGTSDIQDKARGLDLGAIDYVTKPYESIELRARVRSALRTKRMQDLLELRAHVDGLTGLANRMALEERLETEWGIHKRHGGSLAVWVADLDYFKRINDTYGHPTGDEVLRRAGHLLRSTVRTTDLAARYGGEEFVVIAPHCNMAGVFITAERFRERLASASIIVGAKTIQVTVSIGVASWPDDPANSAEDLLAAADQALYMAKSAGRNRVLRCSRDIPGSNGGPPALASTDLLTGS